jgi:hypothetical protein
MDPVKLIGDIISYLTLLALLGALIWFTITRLLPSVG